MTNVSPNVVIMTAVEMMQRLKEAEERGREQGALEAAAKANPAVPNRIFRLKEALLLCGQAAEGSRYAWEGSATAMPPDGGTSLGDRVNRVGEIVRQTFAVDPLDDHRGNVSLAFQLIERYYQDHPELDVRSWFGRLVREKQNKAEPLSALGKAAMQLDRDEHYP